MVAPAASLPIGCKKWLPRLSSPESGIGVQICAETIYQAVYRPDLGGLPRELPGRVLRRRRRQRVPRRDAQRRRSGPVTGMTMLDQRPATAAALPLCRGV